MAPESKLLTDKIRERGQITRLLEVVFITLITLALAYRHNPNDPWDIHSPFPWIALAPVFCSMFYNLLSGVLSLVIVFVFLDWQAPGYLWDNVDNREYIFGLTTLTFLTGAFSSYWLARIKYAVFINRYERDHLSDLTKAYYLLKISHERLEHQYMIRPLSFRDAILDLREEARKKDFLLDEDLALKLLTVCSQYCTISNAAIALFDDHPELKTLASLGKKFTIHKEDPLIYQCLESKEAKYYTVNRLSYHKSSRYLVVLPLMGDKKRIHGLLVIKDMPFGLLTENNLEVLSVFVSCFMLRWDSLKRLTRVLDQFPEASAEFVYELTLAKKLKTSHQIDSVLATLTLPPNTLQQTIIDSLNRQKRALDFFMLVPYKDYQILFIILPFTSINGAYGYKERLERWLKSEFGLVLNQDQLYFRYQLLSNLNVNRQIRQLFDRARHEID